MAVCACLGREFKALGSLPGGSAGNGEMLGYTTRLYTSKYTYIGTMMGIQCSLTFSPLKCWELALEMWGSRCRVKAYVFLMSSALLVTHVSLS